MKMMLRTLELVIAYTLVNVLPACNETLPRSTKVHDVRASNQGEVSAAPNARQIAADVHRTAGDKHRVAEQWQQAAEEYGKSLDADPTQDKIWEMKAYCHDKAGDTNATVATLMKFAETKTNPATKAKLIRHCAYLWNQKGNLEKAEVYYLDATKVLATDDESYMWLAEIHMVKGGAKDMKADAIPDELAKAYDYCSKVVQIKPNATAAYINQRLILLKLQAHYKKQRDAAETEINALKTSKDKAKQAEAKAKFDTIQATIDDNQKKQDAVTAQLVDVMKSAPN